MIPGENHIARILGGLALTLVLLAPSLAQERVDQQDAKKQFEESQRELEATRQQEKQISADIERLAKERAELNTKLIETARRVQSSEARLTDIEKRLEDLSAQEIQVRDSIGARYATISKLLAAMQRIGRQPPPALVTRRDDALAMVRSAMLMSSVFPELKSQAETLNAELQDLLRLGEGIKLQRDNQKAENDKLIEAQRRIGGLIENKKALEQARQQKLASIREAAQRHAKTVSYLGELVQRMDEELKAAGLAAYEAELAARKERERLAKLKENQQKQEKQEVKQVAFVSPGRLKPAIEFSARKGKLSLPVSGKRIRAFGGKTPLGDTAEGISIETRSNAQITSPVDGWVAYADEFRSYGQLLIINAGEGYHILLAGMDRIDVDVGQFVLAGEPVALMGRSAVTGGGNTSKPGNVLYVEFRKGGRPIDPGPWWARASERLDG